MWPRTNKRHWARDRKEWHTMWKKRKKRTPMSKLLTHIIILLKLQWHLWNEDIFFSLSYEEMEIEYNYFFFKYKMKWKKDKRYCCCCGCGRLSCVCLLFAFVLRIHFWSDSCSWIPNRSEPTVLESYEWTNTWIHEKTGTAKTEGERERGEGRERHEKNIHKIWMKKYVGILWNDRLVDSHLVTDLIELGPVMMTRPVHWLSAVCRLSHVACGSANT